MSTDGWIGSTLRDAARERLLGAALACAERDGIDALTIVSVAREAGVSRPTVYRYFAGREALVEQTLLRGAAAFAQGLRAKLENAPPDAAERVLDAVVTALRGLPVDPLLGAALRDPESTVRLTSPLGIAAARHALAPLVELAGWSDADADEAVELILRLAHSLVVAPAPARDEPVLRSFLRRRLLPGLGLSPGTAG